ncbi:unnamed protein product [Symbiodinium sp. CCMP2592]|nr:unnamed protein product [Symbiodinium sp. CCMP2592]
MEAILEQPRLIHYICRRQILRSEPLTPDRVRWASKAVVAFFGWTVAIIAGCLPAFPTKVHVATPACARLVPAEVA